MGPISEMGTYPGLAYITDLIRLTALAQVTLTVSGFTQLTSREGVP